MSVSNSLILIDIAKQQDVFLFCNFERNKKLHIVLLDVNECKAFSGYVTDIDLRSQAAIINMTFSDFLSLSTKALTKKEAEGSKFLYSLEKNCENFIFKWKSVDQDETIISIGNIKVTEKDYGSLVKEVFMMLSNELSNLNSKVISMEEELQSIRKEKEGAVRLASEVTDVKDRVEKELFSKFILILNQKKEKIRSLKRNNDDTSVNATVVSKKKKNMKPKKLHQISDSSDEAMSDIEKADVAGPSAMKHNTSLPFLDDDNEKPILPSPSKRRIRQNNSSFKKVTSHENSHKENPKIIVESESEDELLLNL